MCWYGGEATCLNRGKMTEFRINMCGVGGIGIPILKGKRMNQLRNDFWGIMFIYETGRCGWG